MDLTKASKFLSEEEKIKMVKQLRQITHRGMIECQRALRETDFNMEKAKEYLKEYSTFGPKCR